MAAGRPAFGRPAVFADHVDQSKWVSFTTTLHDPTLLAGPRPDRQRARRRRTDHLPGLDWLASIVIPHQPHFIGQPDGVGVFWGYGLTVDAPGNFVGKPMSECSGREIMTEMLGHLRIEAEAAAILDSLHLHPLHDALHHQPVPAARAGRPAAGRARGGDNLAFIGQFCEHARRRGVHRRIFDPLGADGGLRATRYRPEAAGGLSRLP